VDLSWLSAPESEVAQAMRRLRLSSRPSWVPTRRHVLVHVNHCLMLWYLCIVLMVLGVRIDALQDNRIEARDIRDMVIYGLIFVAWVVGAILLIRWSQRPPAPRARISQWRQDLTALANGYEVAPRRRPTFVSLITAEDRIQCVPRNTREGVEFGNLEYRTRGRAVAWQYLACDLPAPLPHLILDAVKTASLSRQLPVHLTQRQAGGLRSQLPGVRAERVRARCAFRAHPRRDGGDGGSRPRLEHRGRGFACGVLPTRRWRLLEA